MNYRAKLIINKWFSLTMLLLLPSTVVFFEGIFESISHSDHGKSYIAVSAFIIAFLAQRVIVYVFQPEVSIDKNLIFRDSPGNRENFPACIKITNRSRVRICEVRVYVENIAVGCSPNITEVMNKTYSYLNEKGKELSSMEIEIRDLTPSYCRKNQINLRVTVSYVTEMFNFKGFSSDSIEWNK